jgi:myo-inositol-1(or 4)-monophosphatase
MTTPSALLQVMMAAARKAGRRLARDFGEVGELQVSKKGPGDFVSAADLKAEEILVELWLPGRGARRGGGHR